MEFNTEAPHHEFRCLTPGSDPKTPIHIYIGVFGFEQTSGTGQFCWIEVVEAPLIKERAATSSSAETSRSHMPMLYLSWAISFTPASANRMAE